MELLHSFRIRAWHSPAALARILLVLSRRRLRAEEVRVAVADDPGFDDVEIRVRAGDAAAERLRRQFERVVEVVAVRHTEGLPAERAPAPPARRAPLRGRGLSAAGNEARALPPLDGRDGGICV